MVPKTKRAGIEIQHRTFCPSVLDVEGRYSWLESQPVLSSGLNWGTLHREALEQLIHAQRNCSFWVKLSCSYDRFLLIGMKEHLAKKVLLTRLRQRNLSTETFYFPTSVRTNKAQGNQPSWDCQNGWNGLEEIASEPFFQESPQVNSYPKNVQLEPECPSLYIFKWGQIPMSCW